MTYHPNSECPILFGEAKPCICRWSPDPKFCCGNTTACERKYCAFAKEYADEPRIYDKTSKPVPDEMKTGFEAALDYTLDEVRKVMIDRHAKYGPGNILRHGEMGVVVRLGDKYERLDNSRQLDFADESTDDTVLDIIGYGLIMKMLRAGAWPGQSA